MSRPILRKKRAKRGRPKRENVTELEFPLGMEVENSQKDSPEILLEQVVTGGTKNVLFDLVPLVKREFISSTSPDQEMKLKIGMVTSLKNVQDENSNLMNRRMATRSSTRAKSGTGKEMNSEEFLYSLCGPAKRKSKKENIKNLLTLSSSDFHSDDVRLEDQIYIKEEEMSCTSIELMPEDGFSDCNFLINESEMQNLEGQLSIDEGIFIVGDFTDNVDLDPSAENTGSVLESSNTCVKKKVQRGRRKHYCFYCDKLYTNFQRHLIRNHKQEEPVKKYLGIQDKDLILRKRKREVVFDKIRLRFDYIYNQYVIKNSKEPPNINKLLPLRRPSLYNQSSTAIDFVTCKICYGLYSKHTFVQHAKRCFEKSNEDLDSKFKRMEEERKNSNEIKTKLSTKKKVVDADKDINCNLEEFASDTFTDDSESTDMSEDESRSNPCSDDEIIKEMGFSSEILNGVKSAKDKTKTLNTVEEARQEIKIAEKLPFVSGTEQSVLKENNGSTNRIESKNPKTNKDSEDALSTNCDIIESASVHDQLTELDNLSELDSDSDSNDSMDARSEHSGILLERSTFAKSQKIKKMETRRMFCVYCKKHITNFRRHMTKKHRREETVVRYLSVLDKDFEERKRKRRLIFDELRRKGDLLYRESLLQTSTVPPKADEVPSEKYQSTSKTIAKKYVECKICHRNFSKESIDIHMSSCSTMTDETININNYIKDLDKIEFKKNMFKGKGVMKTLGLESIPYSDKASEHLKQVFFPAMRKDKVFYASMQDPLIVSIVSDFVKISFKSAMKNKNQVTRKIRDAGNLVLKLREKDPEIEYLKDCFDPRKLKVLLSTIKEMCGLNEDTGKVDIEGMEYRLLWIIRKSAIRLIDDVTSNASLNSYHKDMVKASVRDFVKKFKCRWQWIMLSKIGHSEEKEFTKPNHEERSKLPTDVTNPSSQIPPTNLDNPSFKTPLKSNIPTNDLETTSSEIPPKDLETPSSEIPPKDLQNPLYKIPPKDLETPSSEIPPKDLETPSCEIPPKDLETASSEIPPKYLETTSSEIPPKDLETTSSEIPPKELVNTLSEILTKVSENRSSEISAKDYENPSSEGPKELKNLLSEGPKKDLENFSKTPTKNLNITQSPISPRNSFSLQISPNDIDTSYHISSYNSDGYLSSEEPPKKRRRRWTDEEKSVVLEHFKEHIKSKTNPGYKKCRDLIMEEPVLKGRTCAQLNILIDNYNRGKITLPDRFLHLQTAAVLNF